jgi:hypothetical protein
MADFEDIIKNGDRALHDKKIFARSGALKRQPELLGPDFAPPALKVAQYVISGPSFGVTSSSTSQRCRCTDRLVVKPFRLVADTVAKITREPATLRIDRNLCDYRIQDKGGHRVGALCQGAVERLRRRLL